MKILKFGGSSVGTIERIQNVMQIIKRSAKQDKIAVVSSAFQGVTDLLIEAAFLAKDGHESYKELFKEIETKHIKFTQILISPKNQSRVIAQVKILLNELEDVLYGIFLIQECSPRAKDAIMSFGERLSCTIISYALRELKIKAEYCDARDLVITDSNYNQANIQFKSTYRNVRKYFRQIKNKIPIITGFIGRDENGVTTTIGRSGSDYTASFFGAALKVKSIEIWTDVSGVLSADPRKVPDAFSLKQVSYKEAMELSHFGAEVIHPLTMIPAIEKRIPIVIKNTFQPDHPGTTIAKKTGQTDNAVKGISSIENITLINVQGSGMIGIPGIAERIFGALARTNINVILISQASSEHSVCFAVDEHDGPKAQKVLKKEFALEIKVDYIHKIEVIPNMTIIAVVGEAMQGTIGISGQLFRSLGKNGISVVAIAQGSSELNISFVIHGNQEIKALNTIHDEFFFHKTQLHLFIIGTGIVGSKLLDQLAEQTELLKNKGIEIFIHSIGDSKKMLLTPGTINLKNWQGKIKKSKTKSDLNILIKEMSTFNFHNCVFVDCTGSDKVAKQYPEIFKKSISIVTPNKKGAAGSMAHYRKLHELSKQYKVKYFYETNVGAGLPIIHTLRDLIHSGDKILKIEGILSGTLSYIFNIFNSKKSFSDIIKKAQENGFTEPDPRDDLSGMDVARKLLILGREIGLDLEMKDIHVQNLTPADCRKVNDMKTFYQKLKQHDDTFAKQAKKAEKENKVLRYVGTVKTNHAKGRTSQIEASLKAYPQDHPFANLKGSDNMIIITTKRYKKTPLIIQGPGAGADVTASGVFADILKIAHHF